ncbi:MAG TPA: redoxin domain-containing protein, partial [Bacillota bacterium]|nr:redoxin domain-containing protein [Bacillota bacterium]
MESIKIGAVAPDFSLKDNKEQIIRLSDFRGKKVLLSWHPLAWTS